MKGDKFKDQSLVISLDPATQKKMTDRINKVVQQKKAVQQKKVKKAEVRVLGRLCGP